MSPPWWPDRFDELFRTNATRVRAHRPGPVQRARARGTAAHRLGRAVRHRGRCRRGLLGQGDLLRPVVTGSSSNDEAVFVILGDGLRSGAAPPETQRAMIAATARLPHIETERTQGHAGRPCLAVRYLEPERSRVVPSVCCDETTATLVEGGHVGRR